ncbi:SKIP/SNW domain-containing protein [Gigaspora rosea]|uniref:Pre-mRNA-processing protein 45 n=1 Tax=Gigaspora rosea TaxID=44941 RepID=A0A397W1L8_9GLOM|nr:SKIP/SNW domain-containing protein [Gigaspora rosea]
MATLAGVLPKPRRQLLNSEQQNQFERKFDELTVTKQKELPPPYGKRVGWKPKSLDDFGDGGAFPEIPIAQYPLEMGRNKTGTSGGALSLQVDAEGNIKYDAIARQGHTESRIVHSQFKDLVPVNQRSDIEQINLDRPNEDEVKETTEKTREALEKIVQGKIKAAQPKNVKNDKPLEPTYIRYTPGQQGEAYNSGATQRIIRMVEMPVDPMEPPKFKHKKIPRGPPSPPAPVLHSPPRKVSAKEQQEWVIPPCISNWKNAKGYTIPLDKRLAADGRGLQEVTINDNFAKLSEALFTADRHAREEVRQRALMREKLAQKEKEEKERRLRMLAQKAREERAGISSTTLNASESESDSESEEEKVREREDIRQERRKEREREYRLSRMGAEQRAKYLAREQNRDISEKIALGLAKPTLSKDSLYDSRLFNQSEGLSSGFKDDEVYDLYDKPLFASSSVTSIYNPKKSYDTDQYGGGDEESVNRMLSVDRFGIASKGFQGADKSQPRDGPVEFEKDEADPFGFNQFLDDAKKGSKRGLDTISESSKKKKLA